MEKYKQKQSTLPQSRLLLGC